MAAFDVFNGDADGLCALVQLRLAAPRESVLVTGVKRDIALLERVDAGPGDEITALDISMAKNRAGLERALAAGARVLYVDHHDPGEIPSHPALTAIVDTRAETCTSLLVNGHLGGRFAAWALVGAYGDNMHRLAGALGASLGIDADALRRCERLGTLLNYNAYGAAVEDLRFAPSALFWRLRAHASPLDFLGEDPDTWRALDAGFRDDIAKAERLEPLRRVPGGAVYALPDAAWARRVSGAFGNRLAQGAPRSAHAIVTARADGGWLVSVRAPLERRLARGADALCAEFPTGGGRAAAAGVNALPAEQLDRFVERFAAFCAG